MFWGACSTGLNIVVFGQPVVTELAEHAGVPVWNGLTDEFHPTQILADFLTMQGTCAETVARNLLSPLWATPPIIWGPAC